ncbi:uncharacterized protein RAG0_03575 [Rhynchosporium agropyri]|uniref:Uncharacterized protein n=1 Tax=Rhynchosporium agropyri TaxID=914238 RepID=A0A1E1K506_9HELO|nr:uncharacterized protein RAG0_03575 [Rhynchosporium agropyri]
MNNPSPNILPPSEDRIMLEWLESQPFTAQPTLTHKTFDDYLAKAAQPRHISGNAGIKLCYYVEQCMRSKSPLIRDSIFAEKPCLDLFHFYIEWNEKNHARSMRQVIELISTMIAKNPSAETISTIKKAIVERDIAIITHQAAQPLVKPAFKSLESLMGKGTITAQDLIAAYRKKAEEENAARGAISTEVLDQIDDVSKNSAKNSNNVEVVSSSEGLSWDIFFLEMFDWMTYADISPAAGKFLVTVFRDLRAIYEMSDASASWQRWIRQGLSKKPEALENVKNYLFPPLFKLDRVGSISFLNDLNTHKTITATEDQGIDAQSLLQLSAMETGKKAGLVEEPDTVEFLKVSKKASGAVILQEEAIGLLLTHNSETVRSLAFSVLISSSSTVRPFSSKTLEILRSSMYILYSDTDAKFRNEILSSTKQMIERLRGAASLLAKEMSSLSFHSERAQELPTARTEDGKHRLAAVKELYQVHNEFVTWYLGFLLLELIPTASYQRHITSLKAIFMFLKSGIINKGLNSQHMKTSGNNTVWPYAIEFYTHGPMRLLMDLLLDPFEDVRNGATIILKLAPHESFILKSICQAETKSDIASMKDSGSDQISKLEFSEESVLSVGLLADFITRAEELSKQTGRADHADGVARSYEILFGLQTSTQRRLALIAQLVDNLERKVEIAEHSLGQAVSEAPIHGNFAALNLVWDAVTRTEDLGNTASSNTDKEQLDDLQLRIATCCIRIWKAVRDILCNDSPEGHMPEDLEEDDEVGTKDVLSYSFRAIHESSNLMKSLVNKIKLKLPTPESPHILPTNTFIQIAELSFEQLSTLRHRGAFSTVTSTFAACCQACVHPNMPLASQELLARWFEVSLECINTQESTTRRSAGIPALITGVLSAHAANPSLDDFVEALVAIAKCPVARNIKDETQYPQVHALNALKEITRSAGIGSQIEPYIASLFELAGESFKSEVFSIKNCGLLLIRGLFDNIFGTSTAKEVVEMGWDGKSTQIDYERYPALVDLIMSLLQMGTDDALFPAMDVLRRAGPPPKHWLDIELLVLRQLKNNHWHVRRIAADCLCSLRTDRYWRNLFCDLVGSKSQHVNHRHGQLMAAKAVLQRLGLPSTNGIKAPSMKEFVKIIPCLRKKWHEDILQYRDAELLTKYAEIRNTIISSLCKITARDEEAWIALISDEEVSALLAINLREHVQCTASHTEISKFPSICQSIARNNLHFLAIQSDLPRLLPALSDAMTLSVDAGVAFIEALSKDFGTSSRITNLIYPCEVYVTAISSTTPRVQIAAMQGLCHMLDQHFDLPRYAEKDQVALLNAVLRLKYEGTSTASPALTISRLGLNGWISLFGILQRMATELLPFKLAILDEKNFRSWSLECVLNGHENVDFDTRFAAAQAQSQFHSRLVKALVGMPISDRLLPSLFGLHTTLNDDDSDVRNLASVAISVVLQRPLVPQAATAPFANYLWEEYMDSPMFVKFVVSKMTGTPTQSRGIGLPNRLILVSAQSQYNEASVSDSQLFAQEKQNLWLDEIEDLKVWASVFGKLPITQFESLAFENLLHPVIADLVRWIAESVNVLKNAASSPDNALGATTKPEVFSVLMRAIITTNTVLDYLERNFLSAVNENPELWGPTGMKLQDDYHTIISGLGEFISNASTNRLHPVLVQTLLMGELGRQAVQDRFKIYAHSILPMGQFGLDCQSHD